jgi:hypothetical protein
MFGPRVRGAFLGILAAIAIGAAAMADEPPPSRTLATATAEDPPSSRTRATATADQPPPARTAATTAVAAPAPRASPEPAEPGLNLRWLPLESRTSLFDFAARNVPGASLSSDGRLRLAGGMPGAAVILVDDYRLDRLSLPIEGMADARVLSAGYGGLGDAPGGALAVSTRPASNRTHAEVESFVEAPTHAAAAVIAPTAAGPILPDRLFFAASGRVESSRVAGVDDPERILGKAPDASQSALTGALKVMWRPGPRHALESLTLLDRGRAENGADGHVAPAAQPTRTEGGFFTGLRWTGDLGRGLLARSQIGFHVGTSDLEPTLCRQNPEECDQKMPVMVDFPRSQLLVNGTRRERKEQSGWQVVSAIEARLPGPEWIEQRMRFTSRVEADAFHWSEAAPSGMIVAFTAPSLPSSRTEVFSNDPRLGAAQLGWARFEGSALRTDHAIEDQARLFGRLWLVPGVGFVASHARTQDDSVLNATAFTFHLGAVWDATADGRTWVRASAHRRVAGDLSDAARFALGEAVKRRCRWDEASQSFSKECEFSGGAGRQTIGLPCGPLGVGADGTTCRASPRLPRTQEYTFGVGRALPGDLSLTVDVLYRRTLGLPSTRETNRVWNISGTSLDGSGGYRTGRPETVLDRSTDEALFSRYLGTTLALAKQVGSFRTAAAYTRGRLESNSDVRFVLPSGSTFLAGEDLDNHPNSFHALGTYDLFGYASFGVVYSYESGGPITRRFRNSTTGDARSSVGVDPGSNINDPADDRPQRRPGVERLNVQLRLHFKPLIRADVDLFADVINFRDWGYVRMLEDIGPTKVMPDRRWFRLGAVFRN